ncbi:agamous-like MADS-box protein AGL11 isoform X1 [Physcomitrium patens]|uniref:Uncharacterized protein n=1 Tax=Physcomitrium patens TaxID=3218 RepID=A0A2K1JHV3_PHYPA|nr:MADS-box transcription factor 5-like [Physcomitrium patens]PNR41132.1 hypothetical protein PHYPA_018535 [Physcomitrium patens]|eukprot:XP_024394528.1 MADS-box transcription factor 5-like [Physcomitrella patens]
MMTVSGQNKSLCFSLSLNSSNRGSLELLGRGVDSSSGGRDAVTADSSSPGVGKEDPPKEREVVMGRGKIEIKKIENPTSRQVTFSKRRGGLLKKAHELAVLCDAEVALIIFSSTGKLFEFASSGSMRDILERYSKCPDGVQTDGNSDFMGREVVKLRQQLERLQHSQRHMLGEDLQVLTVPDLLQLEQQLDMGVSRVRARKNQLLLEEVEELRRKEHDLQAANEELRQKLADAKGMLTLEAGTARAGTSESPGDQGGSWPTREVGGITQHQAITTFPAHLNLRDPQTSQTSLHLGLFPKSHMPSASRRPSQQSPTEPEGESSMRWEHPHFRSQK